MPARTTRKSSKNKALRTAARRALARAEAMAMATEISFDDALRATPDSDLRFADRLRERVDTAAHALRQLMADSMIAAYISDEVLVASHKSKSVEIRLVRVPKAVTNHTLVFRVKPRRGCSRAVGDRVVYAEADLDGSQTSMTIPNFANVTISLSDRETGVVDDDSTVVVTTSPLVE